jgi:hypothetical protein
MDIAFADEKIMIPNFPEDEGHSSAKENTAEVTLLDPERP